MRIHCSDRHVIYLLHLLIFVCLHKVDFSELLNYTAIILLKSATNSDVLVTAALLLLFAQS